LHLKLYKVFENLASYEVITINKTQPDKHWQYGSILTRFSGRPVKVKNQIYRYIISHPVLYVYII